MKTVNLFFYNGSVWNNAVGDMARQLKARLHAPDLKVIFGDKASDGDLVHYFDAGPAAQGTRPGLMGIHQISPRMPGRMLSDRAPVAQRHLGVVVLTQAMAEQIKPYAKRVYVIPGGVGEEFTPATTEERLARVSKEPFTVGLVGHQRHGKFDTKGGEALANVMELCPQYRYRIAGLGWGSFGAEQRVLGHDVRVTERSYRSMPAFYRGLDVLLCLSREEAGGLPILEALACGVPVVSTRVGYAEQVSDGIQIVPFENDQRLADAKHVVAAMAEIYKHYYRYEKHDQDVKYMTDTVADLTWQKYADRHEALYRELLSDA